MLLATGEQISIALTAMAIQELGEQAVSFTGAQIGIVTDSTHSKARIKKIDTQRLREALDSGHIVIARRASRASTSTATSPRSAAAARDTTAVALAAVMKHAGYEVRRARSTPTWTASTPPTRGSCPTPARWTPSATTRCWSWRAWAPASCTRARIEFAKKFDVPLHGAERRSVGRDGHLDRARGGVDERDPGVRRRRWRRDEARLVLEGVPDRPGVSHRVFAALADANIAVDMIAQSVGTGGKATIGFTVLEHRAGQDASGCSPRSSPSSARRSTRRAR